MAHRSKSILISLSGAITAIAVSAFFLWVLFIGRSQVTSPGWIFASVISLASLAGLVGASFSLTGRLRWAGSFLWASGGALVPAVAMSAISQGYLLLALPCLLLLTGGALAERLLGGRRFLWRWAVYLVLIVSLLFVATGVYRAYS